MIADDAKTVLGEEPWLLTKAEHDRVYQVPNFTKIETAQRLSRFLTPERPEAVADDAKSGWYAWPDGDVREAWKRAGSWYAETIGGYHDANRHRVYSTKRQALQALHYDKLTTAIREAEELMRQIEECGE